MTAGPSDDLLIAAMASGDTDAAAQFVRRHGAVVIGVVFAIVGDRHTAEDVSQEVFWRAWRAASSYDPRRGTGEAWLLAIARNAAIDHVRVRRPRPLGPAEMDHLLARGHDDGGTPDERVVAGVDAVLVRRALSRLPEAQRRAIVMAAVGGRTAAEVGRAEGIPLGTAKTRIRTALQRLRDALAESERSAV
jgi:RNA polymerase sigma-70 factor (ECF subfamily)